VGISAISRGDPQWPQKWVFAGLSAAHFGHFMEEYPKSERRNLINSSRKGQMESVGFLWEAGGNLGEVGWRFGESRTARQGKPDDSSGGSRVVWNDLAVRENLKGVEWPAIVWESWKSSKE
jgi:hypothetical protein